MKLGFALLSSLSGAFGMSIPADSEIGTNVLSKARRLDEEVDITWVAGYDIKFNGCHTVAQWNNDEDDGEDDVRVQTKRLVRFRLCPAGYCSDDSAYGCKEGYGDYVVDMDTFVESFLENKQEYLNQKCETFVENGGCYCEDNGDDQFDEEQCMNTCYSSNGMNYCIEDEDELNVNEYAACAEYDPPEANNYYNRKLEEEEVAYFLGPYCAEQGGSIHLGLFTEETCTNFADSDGGRTTFESISNGQAMPYSAYSSTSLVDSNCWSCERKDEENGYYNAYKELNEMCETLYPTSAKCEEHLSVDYPNENACNYLEGIKMVRSSGVIYSGSSSKNKVASAFIGIFAVSFILLGAYVYYLKSKLDRGRINLSD